MYLIAADLVLVVHLLFIGFVVGGSFLAWRWPWIIWVQVPAMVYGALIELVGFNCPLTAVQNYLAAPGGQGGYRGGFISHYLIQVIYPPGLTRGIQVGLRAFRRGHRGDRLHRIPAKNGQAWALRATH